MDNLNLNSKRVNFFLIHPVNNIVIFSNSYKAVVLTSCQVARNFNKSAEFNNLVTDRQQDSTSRCQLVTVFGRKKMGTPVDKLL